MSNLVLAQIDAAISLFTSLLQHGPRTPRYKTNLQWLLNLRTRAISKMSEASATQQQPDQPQQNINTSGDHQSGDTGGHEDPDEDIELLGWRTRLIERAGQDQGRQKTIRTIHLVETPTDSQTTDIPNPLATRNLINGYSGTSDIAMPSTSLPITSLDWGTNDVVRTQTPILRLGDSLSKLTLSRSYTASGTRCSFKMCLALPTMNQMSVKHPSLTLTHCPLKKE